MYTNKEYDKKLPYIFALFCAAVLIVVAAVVGTLHGRQFGMFMSFLFIIISFAIGFITWYALFKKTEIKKLFLLFFAVLGMLHIVFVPVFTVVPDELSHWFRILEISKGNLISDKHPVTYYGGRNLPVNAMFIGGDKAASENNVVNLPAEYKFMKDNISIRLDYNDTKWFSFSNMSYYMPVAYCFQLAGVVTAFLFTDKVLPLLYCGKMFAFLLALLFLYIAISKIPVKKKTFFLLAVTPMFLQEAVSLACDSLVNTACFLFTALILYYASDKISKLGRNQLIVIVVLAITIGLVKTVYFPMVLLVLMIPANKFKASKNAFILFCAAASTIIIANAVWLSVMKTYTYVDFYGVNSAEQVKYILTHPFNYAFTVLKTYALLLPKYIAMFVGARVGAKEAYFHWEYFLYFIYFLCVLIVSVTEKYAGNIKNKAILIGTSCLIVSLITTSLYAQWNTVAFHIVEGIQGRYFIPVSLLLLVSVNINKIKLNEDFVFLCIVPVISIVHLGIFAAYFIRL